MSFSLFGYSVIHQVFSKRLKLFQFCYRDWSFTEAQGSHGAYIPEEKQTSNHIKQGDLVRAQSLSYVLLFAIPWTIVC